MDFDVQSTYSPGMFSGSQNMAVCRNGNESDDHFFNNGGGQEKKDGGGRLISVESTAEWQVNDISYDGQERYLQ